MNSRLCCNKRKRNGTKPSKSKCRRQPSGLCLQSLRTKDAPRRQHRFYPQRRHARLRFLDHHKHTKRKVRRREFYRRRRNFACSVKGQSKNMPDKVKLSDLKGDVFLITDKSKPFFRICEEYCLKSGFAPNVIFECDSQTVIFDLVSADLGVAFCPTFSWGKIDQNRISLIPFDKKCFRKIILIAFKQSTDLQKDFFAYLKRYMSVEQNHR